MKYSEIFFKKIFFLKSWIFIILSILPSCSGNRNSSISSETIDLVSAYQSKKEVFLSSVAESIEYVRLDSSDRCLFDGPSLIAVNDSIIIVISLRKILIFNRQTGAFKYEISSYGRGPSEYLNNIGNSYDEKNNLIYAKQGSNLVKTFSLNGSYISRFRLPKENFEKGKEYSIISFWPVSGSTFIGYSRNYSGINQFKLEVFDSTGKVISRYPNFNYFDKKKYNDGSYSGIQGWFYALKDSVRFFEDYTDSVFTVSNKTIKPEYYIKMGEFSLPFYLQGVKEEWKNERLKYFWLRDMRESSRFLFFTAGINYYRHLCYFDKKLKETKVCDFTYDKEYYRYPTHYEQRIIGLLNDIDDFVPVCTGRGGLYINKNDEMTTYIQPTDMERWFKMNPDKAAKLPEKLKIFSNVKATDNIIVMIVKLKK